MSFTLNATTVASGPDVETTTVGGNHVQHVYPQGIVDSNNSTTSTLSGSGTYTGTGTDVTLYSTLTVMFDTDVDGTLKVQFSADNSNWDREKEIVADTDISTGSVHTFEIISQYYRVVYENGSSAQSHFRLQAILHSAKSGFITSSPASS